MGPRFEPSSLLSPIVIATNKLEIENMSERRIPAKPVVQQAKKAAQTEVFELKKCIIQTFISKIMTVGGKIDLVLLPQVYTYSSVCTFLINDKPMCMWTWYIFRVAEPML